MPLAGGQDETVVAKVGAPCFLAVDAQWVYTFDFGDILLGDTPRLIKAPKSGGTPVTLASAIEDPRGLALDQKAVYWTNQSSETDSISHLDSVEGVALDGSRSFKVAASEKWPMSMVVDGKFAYWLTQNTELRRAPLDGSAAAVTIYSDTSDAFVIFESLAQDATAPYVGVGNSDSITTGKLVKIAK